MDDVALLKLSHSASDVYCEIFQRPAGPVEQCSKFKRALTCLFTANFNRWWRKKQMSFSRFSRPMWFRNWDVFYLLRHCYTTRNDCTPHRNFQDIKCEEMWIILCVEIKVTMPETVLICICWSIWVIEFVAVWDLDQRRYFVFWSFAALLVLMRMGYCLPTPNMSA